MRAIFRQHFVSADEFRQHFVSKISPKQGWEWSKVVAAKKAALRLSALRAFACRSR
jgi:hypothetical protein